MTDVNPSQFVIYQSEDGRTKLDVRFVDETVWLSQAPMASSTAPGTTVWMPLFPLATGCKVIRLPAFASGQPSSCASTSSKAFC